MPSTADTIETCSPVGAADFALRSTTGLNLWWQHVRAPLLLFMLVASTLAITELDVTAAQAWFFDAQHSRWVGAGTWWANEFLHTGGRWAIRIVVLVALCTCVAATRASRFSVWRRPAAYLAISIVLSISIIGSLKVLTSVNCPWDLGHFGGQYPFVPLFAPHAELLHRGHCFPAAHAGSGYALFALYFMFVERSAKLARSGLALGAVCGLMFGLAQQSRGAHFISHDVWSAFIAWMVALTVYVFPFRACVWIANSRSNRH